MTELEWIAIGTALTATLLIIILPRFYENLFTPLPTQDSGVSQLPLPIQGSEANRFSLPDPNEAPWKRIGGSTVAINACPVVTILREDRDEPIFKTLRVETSEVSEAKWKFRIKFVFVNKLKETIVIDDIHTRIYERSVPTPGFATISYRGEVMLLQDNTIWKDNASYSLNSDDGYEMVLVLEMTRLEGAPQYGSDEIVGGPVRTVFGLLIDYYTIGPSGIERRTLPSDCLYLFQHESAQGRSELKAVDAETIEEFKHRYKDNLEMKKVVVRLDNLLKEHLLFRPTPKP